MSMFSKSRGGIGKPLRSVSGKMKKKTWLNIAAPNSDQLKWLVLSGTRMQLVQSWWNSLAQVATTWLKRFTLFDKAKSGLLKNSSNDQNLAQSQNICPTILSDNCGEWTVVHSSNPPWIPTLNTWQCLNSLVNN